MDSMDDMDDMNDSHMMMQMFFTTNNPSYLLFEKWKIDDDVGKCS